MQISIKAGCLKNIYILGVKNLKSISVILETFSWMFQ